MARDSTKTLWRVQVRKSRAHKWTNKGLFETREDARTEVSWHRYGGWCVDGGLKAKLYEPLGFGNTRVVPHIRGQK